MRALLDAPRARIEEEGGGGGVGVRCANVAERPNLMSLRSTCLLLDTKYPTEDTKLRSSVEHTLREKSKIHIFSSGSQMRE